MAERSPFSARRNSSGRPQEHRDGVSPRGPASSTSIPSPTRASRARPAATAASAPTIARRGDHPGRGARPHRRRGPCIGCGEVPGRLPIWSHQAPLGRRREAPPGKDAEYALCVHAHFKARAVFLNFLVKITKDCDCMAKDEPRIVPDIGLLASRDPVAVDAPRPRSVVAAPRARTSGGRV